MIAMPDSQENQNAQLAELFVVKESQTFVDVAQDPAVGVDIEGVNQVLEFVTRFIPKT